MGCELNETNFFPSIENKKFCASLTTLKVEDNGEVTGFLHKFFNLQNKLRMIFFSTVEPKDEIFAGLQLKGIGEGLMKGLDKDSALEFVKVEGKKSGLDKVAEDEPDKLLKFLDEEVSFNPQAIRSLIKFFEIKRNLRKEGFDAFTANFKEGFYEFEKSRDRFKEINDKLRPTLYLISLQIEAQDEPSRELLSVLALKAKFLSWLLKSSNLRFQRLKKK